MSERSKSEYLAVARGRYRDRGREGRSRLLDEVCEVCALSRKHAIKVLRGKAGTKGRRGRSGRGHEYGVAVGKVVEAVWKKAEQPCNVRLKAALPVWLGSYEKWHGALDEALRAKVLSASARTLERLLATKKSGRKARRWHGRGSHGLKQQIEVRCGRWEVEGPGRMEADTAEETETTKGNEAPNSKLQAPKKLQSSSSKTNRSLRSLCLLLFTNPPSQTSS